MICEFQIKYALKKKQDVLEILQNQRKILQSNIYYYLNHLSHFQRIT